jgi:hypothetical protein
MASTRLSICTFQCARAFARPSAPSGARAFACLSAPLDVGAGAGKLRRAARAEQAQPSAQWAAGGDARHLAPSRRACANAATSDHPQRIVPCKGASLPRGARSNTGRGPKFGRRFNLMRQDTWPQVCGIDPKFGRQFNPKCVKTLGVRAQRCAPSTPNLDARSTSNATKHLGSGPQVRAIDPKFGRRFNPKCDKTLWVRASGAHHRPLHCRRPRLPRPPPAGSRSRRLLRPSWRS